MSLKSPMTLNCTQGACADRASAIDAFARQKTSAHDPTWKREKNQHVTTEATREICCMHACREAEVSTGWKTGVMYMRWSC